MCTNALARMAKARKVKQFKILPKHHALTHIGYDSYTNPRRNHCYQDFIDVTSRSKLRGVPSVGVLSRRG